MTALASGNRLAAFDTVRELLPQWTFDQFRLACRQLARQAKDPARTAPRSPSWRCSTTGRYSTGAKKRSHVLQSPRRVEPVFGISPARLERSRPERVSAIDFGTREHLRRPQENETTLVINAAHFPPEGGRCDAGLLVDAFM